jgi:hypothetical protein
LHMTSVSHRYVTFLSSHGRVIPIAILCTWTVLAIVGGSLTPLFLLSTTNDMGVPPDAPSVSARKEAIRVGFNLTDGRQALTVLTVNNNQAEAFTDELQHVMGHRFGTQTLKWDGWLMARRRGETLTSRGYMRGAYCLSMIQVDPKLASVTDVAHYLREQVMRAVFVCLSSSQLYL